MVKRRVKDSLASWLLSLTVLENTHFRRKCAEALKNNLEEGRGDRFWRGRGVKWWVQENSWWIFFVQVQCVKGKGQ